MSGIISDLADGMRRLQKISKDLNELDLREAMIEQRELLLAAREEINHLRESNECLRNKLKAVEDSLAFRNDLEEIEGFKYDVGETGPKGLPFCPNCEVREGKMFRLIRLNDQYSQCPNCKTDFNAASDGRVHESRPLKKPTAARVRGRTRM